MPMTFPAHQGLILPVMRRWPNSFDALALSVGAAMPDVTDTVLGFLINGYFKQWYGHALIGIFTLDLLGGLAITWLIAIFVRRFRASLTKTPPRGDLVRDSHTVPAREAKLRPWIFSSFVGIFSHVGFDLISHDTNLLLYPWYDNPHWFPTWWYTTWFKIRPLRMFGKSYSVGVFSIIWGLLTLVGIGLFVQFVSQKHIAQKRGAETDSHRMDYRSENR
jgi:hypothetical protein